MLSTTGQCVRRRFIVAIVVMCGLTLTAFPAGAGQGSDATIFGLVTDESGAVLPGVTVTVSSPALQVKQVVEVTSATGEYRVTPLPLGVYTVEFSLSGFQVQRREGVRLTAGFVAKIDIQLKVGAVEETVTVSGQSPVVDVKTTSAGTEVTREILQSVPTARNGMQSFLTLAAGSRSPIEPGRLGGSDPVLKAFGRGNNGWVTVDGVSTASPRLNSAFKNDFNYQSIEEANITTVGGSAEAPNSGIQINVVTKTGSNAFHGEVPYSVTPNSSAFQANNVDAALQAQNIADPSRFYSRWDVAGDLGGKIVPDKVWFYGAARRRKENGNIQGGPPYPDGTPSQFDMTQSYLLGKGTVQLTPTQRLSGFTQYRRQPWQQGPSGLGSPEQTYLHTYRTLLTTGVWQAAQENKFLTISGGRYHVEFLPQQAYSNISRWSDSTLKTSGGIDNANVGAGLGRDAHRYELKGTFTLYKSDWISGSHEFKLGANYTSAADIQYTFDVGPCQQLAIIASFCNPNGPTPGNYVLVYKGGVPSQLQARNNPINPTTRLDQGAAYLQDSWAIGRQLTLNLGVRYSNDRGWIPAQCRDAAPAPFASLYPAQCFAESHPISTYNHVVPRLHASYDVMGDGKTVIKGGWGRFYQLHIQDELDISNPDGNITSTFKWHPAVFLGPGQDHFTPGDSNLDLNGADFVSQSVNAVSSDLVGLTNNPSLKQPGSDEWTLSLERQLMPNFSLRVTGVYVKEFNTLRILNTSRPYSAYNVAVTAPDPGPDGKVGTADDAGTLTYYDYPASLKGVAFQTPIYINDANADASYKSFEIAGTKRLSNRWQFLAAFTATKKHIPVTAANGNAVGVPDFNPNAEINTADNTWEWGMRSSGSYLLPYDIQVATNFQVISGDTWGRTVSVSAPQVGTFDLRVEPIGTRNTGTQTTVGLQVQKGIRLRGSHRATVGANILNLLNANYIATASNSGVAPSGSANVIAASGATFGFPNAANAAAVAFPRLIELVFKYSF